MYINTHSDKESQNIMCISVCVCVCPFQILACVFVFEMQKGFCWVIQLFSLVCTVKGYYDRKALISPQFLVL